MTQAQTTWIEIAFSVAYLLVVWALVAAMFVHRGRPTSGDREVARLARWAFMLLALGDTCHVGFRVWAYGLGGLHAAVGVAGRAVGLVGLGALATAITVTLFYVLMLKMWHARFHRPYGWLGALLLASVGVRFVLMLPDGNLWNSPVPVQPWSTVRNLPLMVLGLGVAYLILRDARRAGDRLFRWIGAWILVSYACYLPVIFFVQAIPALGMLMIPKTLAYLAIAWLIWRDLYHPPVQVPALAGV